MSTTTESSAAMNERVDAATAREGGPVGGRPVAPRRPLVHIRAGRRDWGLQLAELYRFRDLAMALAMRDVRLRYKQTVLGVMWVVLQPLIGAGVFTLVFGLVAKLPSDGLPYFVFSYAGLLGWGLFSNLLGKTSTCLLGSAHLISKVYFPRLIIPLGGVPGALLDFGVAAGMMGVLLAWYQIAPGWTILLLPVWLLILGGIAMGVGLVATSLAVSYRDVNYIMPVVTQILMWASPSAYSLSAVPEKVRVFYLINPLTGALEGLRWSLLGTTAPSGWMVGYSVAAAVVAVGAGLVCFKLMERRFADVI